MPIVTLTTDWGTRDYYLPSFKGMLATHCPNATVIDISNEVDHFDILQASFILKNCYEKFPEGTIHFIGVRGNDTRQKSNGYLLIECKKHFFIGYDNGIFSLSLEDAEKKIFLTGINVIAPEHEIMERIVEIIASISKGIGPETFCSPTEELISVINSTPSFDHESIRGSIIYIDSFQNIISNIPGSLFTEKVGDRTFSIIVRNHVCKFKKVYAHYSDAETGEPVCLFNEKGLLELALNGANAAGLLGVKVLDNIRVEFQDSNHLPKKERHSPSNATELTEN
ncbi:MAG: SAM-dependent chlorinase/fluorinase [Bacteroidota bacterium]